MRMKARGEHCGMARIGRLEQKRPRQEEHFEQDYAPENSSRCRTGGLTADTAAEGTGGYSVLGNHDVVDKLAFVERTVSVIIARLQRKSQANSARHLIVAAGRGIPSIPV